MNDTLFVQFYSRTESFNPRFKNISHYEVCNGFSDTWNLCKSKGDFLWINHSKQEKSYGTDIIKDVDPDLPIKKGIVYVSAYYLSHLHQVLKWAIRYPNIKFIAGGPACSPKVYKVDETIIPSNLTIINCTVEEYFGVPNFSNEWKLELPNEDHSMTLNFMYTLMNTCYWGKCVFCNFSKQKARFRPEIKFEFLNVDYQGNQRINLYSPSVTPKQLKTILGDTSYNEKIRYDIYLRANKNERDVLKELFINKQNNFPSCKFFLGIEFPSNRMLNYMKKNNTIEDFIDTIKMISEYGNKESIMIHLPFIMGWDNLLPSDVSDMEYFLKKLDHKKTKFVFSVNMLRAFLNTPIYDMYTPHKDLYVGPFYYGFKPVVEKNQMELIDQCMNLLYDQGVTVLDYRLL